MTWKPPLSKTTGKPCKRCKKGRLCPAHDGKSRSGGAPTVFTNDKKTDFLNAIRAGGPSAKSIASACRYVGWNEDTYRRWKRLYEEGKANPELATFFGEELPKAMEARRLKAYSVLAKSMDNDDPRIRLDAAKYTLTNLHGDELTTATHHLHIREEEREVEDLRRLLKAFQE